MASIISAADTFTRANASIWGTASDTEGWTPVIGLTTTRSIVSNKGRSTGVAGSYGTQLGAGNAVNATYTMRVTPSATTGPYWGFLFAYKDINNYCYTESRNNYVAVYKVVAGVNTLVLRVTIPTMSSGSYWKQLVQSGNTVYLQVWQDGTSQPLNYPLSATDPAFGLRGGYGTHGYLNNTTEYVDVDSFSVIVLQQSVYLSPTGNDVTGDGSFNNPWASISYALSIVNPGTSLYFFPGTYNLMAGYTLYNTASGTPLARIALCALTNFQTYIVANNPLSLFAMQSDGNYVDISGLDITCVDTVTRVGILNNGSYCTIHHNKVHDLPASTSGVNGGAGIDNGNYSALNNDTYNNICINIGNGTTGFGVHGIYHAHKGGKIYNNLCFMCLGWGIHTWHAATNLLIANNLCGDNYYGGIVIGAVAAEVSGGTHNNSIVVNNIIVGTKGAGGALIEVGDTGPNNQYLNNLVFNCALIPGANSPIRFYNGIKDSGTLYADPKLVNYLPNGTGDYHLTSASPAIGAGKNGIANLPVVDFDGVNRNSHQGPDIGPYEFVGQPTLLTATVGNGVEYGNVFIKNVSPAASTPTIQTQLGVTDPNGNALTNRPYNVLVTVLTPSRQSLVLSGVKGNVYDQGNNNFTVVYPAGATGYYIECWLFSGGGFSTSFTVVNQLT